MNGLKSTPAQLQRRKEVVRDLYEIVKEEFEEYKLRDENDSLLGYILDEYIYKCTELEVDELEDIIVNHFGID